MWCSLEAWTRPLVGTPGAQCLLEAAPESPGPTLLSPRLRHPSWLTPFVFPKEPRVIARVPGQKQECRDAGRGQEGGKAGAEGASQGLSSPAAAEAH